MRGLRWALGASAAAMLAGAPAALGAEGDVVGHGLVGAAEVGVYSARYDRSEDLFGGVLNLQPSVALGWAFDRAELGLELWGAFPLHDRGKPGSPHDELDVTVATSVALTEALTCTGGVAMAFVPAEGGAPGSELLVGAELELGAGFAVAVEGAVPLERGSGIYVAAGPTWHRDLGSAWHTELGAAVGATRFYGEALELVELRVSAGLAAALGTSGATTSFGVVVARNPSLGATTGSVGLSLGWQR
jgi:hypothetical protein